MKIKYTTQLFIGLILTISSMVNLSYAGLIEVDFNASEITNAPITDLAGSFVYDNVTYELLEINLTVAGVIRTIFNTDIQEISISQGSTIKTWFLGSLEPSISGVSTSNPGSFILSKSQFIFASGVGTGLSGTYTLNIDELPIHQDVPEPSTLAIFALGIIGLASRRFKNQ